ncbi:hypothetical protein HWI79_1140 [Cryptosporidium felis]|nr:hypothetical protein HWI79_1140 [Cryptosporidium felis]
MKDCLKVWNGEDVEELFRFIVKLINNDETRNKILEKVEQKTGIFRKQRNSYSDCRNEGVNTIGIKKFSNSDQDTVGNLIDRSMKRDTILEIMPKTIKKSFSAFRSLRGTCIGRCENNKRIELNFNEYNLMKTVFEESIVYCFLDKVVEEINNNNCSSMKDISRWASPYIIKDKTQKLDAQLLYELNEFGISMKSVWLGEEMRSSIYKDIVKRDYHGMFIDGLKTKMSDKNLRFITLEYEEICDEMLLYFKSIEELPNELNARLGRNLNVLSKSLSIFSLQLGKSFSVEKGTNYYIPGSQIGIIYFPCKESIQITCKNIKTEKHVEFEISNDKLLFIDVNKNKVTLCNNNSAGKVTYYILTYIFGPT